MTSKMGRPPKDIEYAEVEYNDNYYIVGKINKKDIYKYFIIDKEDFNKIYNISLHLISTNYISHTVYVDNKRPEMYLHNIIMNRYGFPGKGATETVDHINRNPLDNRKENLRIITQSEQNMNQNKKKRNVVLPEDSELTAADIPKHVWYVKANGDHGDRFAIEFKTENIVWKTTSSKKVSLKDKLAQAKEKLQQLYEEFPNLNPDTDKDLIKDLNESYNAIVEKAMDMFE
jgi:hypothetical protein